MTDAAERLGTEALSADEISDAVWLAAQIAAAEPQRRSAGPSSGPTPPTSPPSPLTDPPASRGTQASPQAALHEFGFMAFGRSWSESKQHVAVPSVWERSTSPELPRGLAKALHPLSQLVPSTWHQELDEEQTAIAAAESGMWLPVHRPAQEHPFDLVLVVDRGSSMRIWDWTVDAFRALLEHQGAFTDVKTVTVNTDETTIRSVETAPGTASPPALLADPTGRRIVLVLTDGVGHAWRSGSMYALMSIWARTCRVALVHLLPPERWNWTGIHVRPATLFNSAPDTTDPIPVLALERRYLQRWAELTSGTNGIRLPVLVPPQKDSESMVSEEMLPPEERLHRFRATATPQAVRLAGLLAGAPLTLQVIEAVQRQLLPQSEPWHVAEVLLSGLLRRVPSASHTSHSPVEYEFASGVRRSLLAIMTRDDTANVLRVVEDVLGSIEPTVGDLRHVLTTPDDVVLPVITSHNERLVAVQREVLAAMSGPYARRANRLGDALDAYNTSRRSTRRVDQAGTEPNDAVTSATPDHSRRMTQPPLGISYLTMTSSEPGIEVRRSEGQPALWGGVPLRNVNFIGRKDLLASLHVELSKSTATAVLPGALHGMGGIGKSQIALEYVYRHAKDYELIWWVPAENPSEIQASLVKLAQQLHLPVEQSVDTAVPAVLDALSVGEPYRRWLLVFDNADQPADVQKFWPRRGAGHILVTSRNPQWWDVAQPLEVDVFKREESRELLQRRNVDLPAEDADRLAIVLGDLPLAIEQAAAWRAETGMPTDEYLQLLEDKRTELLESRPPTGYDLTVEAAWNVSLDRLKEENTGAHELLEVCAFFSPEPITRSIFSGVRNVPVSPALEQILADPIHLGRAIREIARYSLVRLDHRTDTLQLHRLVQLVLRNKLTPDDQERVRHTAHVLLANQDPRKPDAVESWPRYAEILPHIRAMDAHNCTDHWVRRMMINSVNYLFAFGYPFGALEMAQIIAQFWSEEETLGPKHPDTLIISRWWSRLLRALGRFDEGQTIGEQTLEFMRETLGETHEETLLTMHGVASGLRAKGEFYKARDMNAFAYRSAVERFGEDDPDTLAAANNYALSLRLAGEFFAARDLDEQTWQRKKTVLGEDHRHTLLTLDNWSVDLREAGDYLTARAEQEHTVSRMRILLGNRHPMTLSAIKNLAIQYRKAGLSKNQMALRLAEEAMQGLVTKYGESHPDAMSALMNVSIEHRQNGDLEEASRLGKHVKNLYETTWGMKHPFSIAAATNLAVTLRLQRSFSQARELNKEALADMREALGEDHPFTLACATNYASDLAASEQYEAAYALDQETYSRSVRVLGEDHPSTLGLLVNQTLDLRGLGRINEADSMLQTAVRELRQVLGATHPATNAAQLNQRANCEIDPMRI